MVVVLMGAGLFPPLCHVVAIETAWRRGWAAGKRDWDDGTAVLYIDYSLIPELTGSLRPVDPLSGLPLRFTLNGLQQETWQNAHSAAVNDELAKVGKRSLSQYVFPDDGLERLFNDASFREIPKLPFQIGEQIQLGEGPEGISVDGLSTCLDSEVLPRQFASLRDPEGLVILRCGGEAWTMLEDGTLLQYVTVLVSNGRFRVLP